jgi:dihydrofolate reductase
MVDEFMNYADKFLLAADALLLGRVTFRGFSSSYPRMTGRFADRMNSLPKYVASTTIHDTAWNATIIEGDIAMRIAELKQQPGQNILKYGTGPLDRLLMEHNLVDEFHFCIVPVVAKAVQRLFENIKTATNLKLVETTTFESGIVVLTHTPSS